MADIISTANALSQGKAGVKRVKRLSTRVDLTPMVDHGFLLLTFFIFTTTFSEPRALSLVIPARGDSTETGASKTLNIILAADNKVHYYAGNDVGKQVCTDFSPEGIRKAIRNMQDQVKARYGEKEQLVVLIRPTVSSSYMNLVDILDEMLILDVKKYALMDAPPIEELAESNTRKPC